MRAILWTCASLILIANIPALASAPINVGHAKQLFIDDQFIESSEGVTRSFMAASRDACATGGIRPRHKKASGSRARNTDHAAETWSASRRGTAPVETCQTTPPDKGAHHGNGPRES